MNFSTVRFYKTVVFAFFLLAFRTTQAQGQAWTSQDVGSVGVAGTATAVSSNAFVVAGSGADCANDQIMRAAVG